MSLFRKNKCSSCGDKIDANQSFQADDEEIFEAVMELVEEKQMCIECAMTSAVIDKSFAEMDEKGFGAMFD